MSFKRPLA